MKTWKKTPTTMENTGPEGMGKRILSLMLCLVMILSMFPMTVFAEESADELFGEATLADVETLSEADLEPTEEPENGCVEETAGEPEEVAVEEPAAEPEEAASEEAVPEEPITEAVITEEPMIGEDVPEKAGEDVFTAPELLPEEPAVEEGSELSSGETIPEADITAAEQTYPELQSEDSADVEPVADEPKGGFEEEIAGEPGETAVDTPAAEPEEVTVEEAVGEGTAVKKEEADATETKDAVEGGEEALVTDVEADPGEDLSENDPAEQAEETEETEQFESARMAVIFGLTPEEAKLTLYLKNETDEVNVMIPEEDGSYLLEPGVYYYTLEADGYISVPETELIVYSAEETIELNLVMTETKTAEEPKDEEESSVPIKTIETEEATSVSSAKSVYVYVDGEKSYGSNIMIQSGRDGNPCFATEDYSEFSYYPSHPAGKYQVSKIICVIDDRHGYEYAEYYYVLENPSFGNGSVYYVPFRCALPDYDATPSDVLGFVADELDAHTATDYKLHGTVSSGGKHIKMLLLTVSIYEANADESVDEPVMWMNESFDNESGEVSITTDSSISSALDFSTLTPGRKYKLVWYLRCNDECYPIGQTIFDGLHPDTHQFTKSGTIPFTMEGGSSSTDVKVSISGVRAPSGTLTYGNSFTLKGKITATGAKLSEVSAKVYAASDTSFSNALTGKAVSTTAAIYSIEGSALDTNCKFGTLEPGSYVYLVRTKAGGKSFKLYQSSFKVSKPTYTVTYNGNGYWTGIPADQTKTYNVNLKLRTTVPTRENYEFMGWATSKTATTATYQPGDTYKENKNVTLYAVWKKLKKTISLCPNDTAHSNQTIVIAADLSYQFGEYKYKKDGYDLIGWAETSDAEVPEYRIGDYYTSKEDITLFGVYQLKTFKISFDANGGAGAPDPVYKEYMANAFVMPATVPIRDGYVFDGWASSPDAEEGRYSAGAVVLLQDEEQTFYAIWKPDDKAMIRLTKHLLEFHARLDVITEYPEISSDIAYGFYSDDIETIIAQYNIDSIYDMLTTHSPYSEPRTRSTNTTGKTIRELGWEDFLEIDDREFYAVSGRPVRIVGWSTEEHGRGTVITADTILEPGITDIYPIFQIDGHYVYFDANGGMGAPDRILKNYQEQFTIPDSIPVMEGFEFDGWATDPKATEVQIHPGENCNVQGNPGDDCWNITFYAVWKNAFSVEYRDSSNRFVQYYPNGIFSIPEEIPHKSFTPTVGETVEYTFGGWATDINATEPEFLPGETYQLTSNITVYPVWKADFAALIMKVYLNHNDFSSLMPFRQYYDSPANRSRNTKRTYSYASNNKGMTVEELGWVLFDENDFPGVVYEQESSYKKEGRIQGWYTGENGTGERITMNTVVNEMITIYPYGECLDYRVKYSSNGGTGTPEPEYVNAGESILVTTEKPSRRNYSFQGWATDPDVTAAEYHAGDSFTPTEDSVLYAVWQVLPHTHEIELHDAKKQNCTENGYSGDIFCTFCEQIVKKGEVLPATGHTSITKLETKTPATCTEGGEYEEIIYCEVCGLEISRETKVKTKAGHIPGNPFEENRIPATCTVDGSIDEVVLCALCGEEISCETKKIAKLGHSWGKPTYTWSSNNSTVTAKRVCSNDTKHAETETANTTSKVNLAATCTTKGKTTYAVAFKSSAFAAQTKTMEDIPALGHQYGEPVWSWNGTSSATATFTCAYDGSHKESVAASITSKTTPASYSVAGKTVFTAKVSFNGKTYTDTATKTIKKLTLAKPTSVTLKLTRTGIQVSWKAVAGAERYYVQRRISDGNWKKIGYQTGTSFTDPNVTSGKQYSYRVRARRDTESVNGTYKESKTVEYLTSPTILSIANAKTGVTVKWAKIAGAAKYRIWRKEAGGSWKKLGDTTKVSYTDKTVKSGTKYSYRIKCVNAEGKTVNAYSATKSITFVKAPVISSVTAGTGKTTVKWSKVTGATKYRVFRKGPDDTKWIKLGDMKKLTFTDKTAVNGTRYSYAIRAYNGTAKTWSAQSAAKSIRAK